jgi:hypothetical protein
MNDRQTDLDAGIPAASVVGTTPKRAQVGGSNSAREREAKQHTKNSLLK